MLILTSFWNLFDFSRKCYGIKIDQHCLKRILQKDPSMGETIKNVALPLISKMLLKNVNNSVWLAYSRTSLKLEFFLKIKTVAHRGKYWLLRIRTRPLGIIWWRRKGWGRFRGFLFFSIFEGRFRFFRRLYFRLPFALWCRLFHFFNTRLFERIGWVFIITLLSSLSGCGCFFHRLIGRTFDMYKH